ncbi:uncharacterized protein RCO7_02662 [Rhynchosporium graminicola]|uniref:Uncharacterized protein n=1 Tax=Rhynchosporium graminicola TaxID=2792576 RepID=A0A1E1KFZ1_9HELO|nr:uncharacterized protein RCO7_02662 [Rhynchosporium commune]
MLTRTCLFVLLTAASAVSGAVVCTPERRIAGGKGVISAYAQTLPGATYAAFSNLPLGIGGLGGKCITTILADGLPGAPVGFTGRDVVNFGTATRQVFSKVTGFLTDFPQNNSMVINNANITLGLRSIVKLPVTFNADVYLDYSPAPDCRIQAVRAYARLPSEVLGMITAKPGVPPLIAGLIGTDNPINDWFGTPPTTKSP